MSFTPPITVNADDLVEYAKEVVRLLDEKKFLAGFKHNPRWEDRLAVLNTTEVIEIAQDYKRKGFTSEGISAMTLEAAGTAVRAFNFWPVYNVEFEYYTGSQVMLMARASVMNPGFKANMWSLLRSMVRNSIEPSAKNSIMLIADAIFLCHHHLGVDFKDAWRKEMDKNWGREEQYNLAPEHKK